MSLWLIMVGRGERSLMEQFKEEIKSAYDILSRLGHRQAEINKAIDRVTEAHNDLNAKQAGFGELMDQAEKLMKANPDVEAVECGGTGQVLVRLPSGGVSVLALSHWYSLGMPDQPEPESQVLPPFKPDVPLIPEGESKVIFDRIANVVRVQGPTRNDGGFTSLSTPQIDSPNQQQPKYPADVGVFVSAYRDPIPVSQDAHDRIQAGKPSQADVDLMAASHAWAETFDDPDLPEEDGV